MALPVDDKGSSILFPEQFPLPHNVGLCSPIESRLYQSVSGCISKFLVNCKPRHLIRYQISQGFIMISGLSQSIGLASPLASQANVLSDQQQASLKDLLSRYDASNLSETDAKAIVSGIQSLGIKEGAGLATAMSANGFDARSVGDMGGVKGDRPPPPPPGGKGGGAGQINTEALTALQLFVDAYEGNELSQADWTSIMSSLEEQGFDTSKPFIDLRF